jgi:hypothetical protein
VRDISGGNKNPEAPTLNDVNALRQSIGSELMSVAHQRPGAAHRQHGFFDRRLVDDERAAARVRFGTRNACFC